MDNKRRKAIREEMANQLEKVIEHAGQILSMWYEFDLEGDFLAEDEYPFDMSLDDWLANARGCVEKIEERNEWLALEPITLTVGEKEFNELLELLEREPRELPKLRALLERARK